MLRETGDKCEICNGTGIDSRREPFDYEIATCSTPICIECRGGGMALEYDEDWMFYL